MSNVKKVRRSNLYALNLHDPNDPLGKVLEYVAHRSPEKYIRIDQSVNKMRLIHDVVVVGLRKLLTDWKYQEGLRLLDKHECLYHSKLNNFGGVTQYLQNALTQHKSLKTIVKEFENMQRRGKTS